MEEKQVLELLNKYHEGTITSEEKAILESWYINQASITNFDLNKKEIDRNLEMIGKGLPLKYNTIQATLWLRIVSAAAILIFISLGMYFYTSYNSKLEENHTNSIARKEITPGGNKAILTLADGRKVSLTDANNGDIDQQNGTRITKTADGQLVYEAVPLKGNMTKGSSPIVDMYYNTIETPRGGQYQIVLPDGSKVWLNAASSMKYPSNFISHKERRVELNGEAYFEVAKDNLHPFIVSTNKQEVKVLGTHFNISAYSDESQLKTTLLEGSVVVYKLGVISPSEGDLVKLIQGQQSIFDGTTLKVSTVEVENVIAWKNGYFRFDDESLLSIMHKISRWYDVDIIWRDESAKSEPFAAVTTRFANVNSLLKMMEQTGDVKFDIEENKIIISKKNSDLSY